MNIRQLMFLLSVGAFALTGCDQAYDIPSSTSTALVFTPDYLIDVDGQGVSIAGFDECPRQSALMTRFFGPAPNDGSIDCIVISEDRSTVSVRLFLPSDHIVEDWEIIRETGELEGGRVYLRTSLKRPSGELVVPSTIKS